MWPWRRHQKPRMPLSMSQQATWEETEIPRYPPFMKGLPAVPPDQLIETQAELVDRITSTAIASPEIFERHYMAAMRRFAAFAHLLPASQSHHHRGAGGLLRHAVEVGLWALQASERVLLQGAQSPQHRREMEPRWQLAVFLAALCHDAGKPVTDLTITNKDRSSTWSPITEDLYAWAKRNKVDAYFLDWREGRARQHTALSSLIAERIIGSESLAWIAESETELVVWLMESLACNPSPSNLIHDLVVKADQSSVERDLKTLGVAMAGYDIGVPVERHLTDIMRRFVREGVWLVNEPGARLWNIGGDIYLVWPAAGEELAKQIREDGIPGIPRTPDGILDMLVDRQLVSVRQEATLKDRFWKIAPEILTQKIPDLKLSAIRVRDDGLVSAVPIPAVDGVVVTGVVAEPSPHGVDPSGRPDSADDPAMGVDHLQVSEVEAPPDTSSSGDPAIPEQASSSGPSINPPAKSRPAVDRQELPEARQAGKGSEITGPQAELSESSRSRVSCAPDAAAKPAPVGLLDGAVGEALKAFAEDLRVGAKQWGRDAVQDGQGHLQLAWPGAFSGYGLTPKAILGELSAREWLWIDPMAPLRRVLDMEINGTQGKVVRLTREVSMLILALCEGEGSASRSQQPMPETRKAGGSPAKKPPTTNPQLPPRPPRTAKDTKSTKKMVAEAASVAQQLTLAATGGDDPTSDQPPTAIDLPGISIADILAVAWGVSGMFQAGDGSVHIPKARLIAECSRQGLKLTHRQLSAIARQQPDRLSIKGCMVQCKK